MSRTLTHSWDEPYNGYIYEVRYVSEQNTAIYDAMGWSFDEGDAAAYSRLLSEDDDAHYVFVEKYTVVDNNRVGLPSRIHTFVNGLRILDYSER